MKCPICQNELEIKHKKAGETENGDTIYNEFAICHDCKKQWNLDKQRAKSDATSSRPSPDADVERPKRKKRRPAPRPEGSAVNASETADTSKDSAPVKRKKRPVSEVVTKSDQVGPTDAPSPDAPRPKKKKRPAPKPEGAVTAVDTEAPAPRPRKKKRPASTDENLAAKTPTKRPTKTAVSEDERPKRIKKRPPVEDLDDIEFLDEEITYSNIPPKHVRDTREKEMRTNYQNMVDEDDEDNWDEDERRFPVWIVVIIVLIVLAAAGFAGYWFFLR